MTPETIDKIKEALTPIADKIGQGAEFGWEVVMRQQYVDAVIASVWAFVGLCILIGAYFFARFAIETKRNDKYGDSEAEIWGTFSTVIISLIGLIIFCANLEIAITHFLNPAYYALEFFINLAK